MKEISSKSFKLERAWSLGQGRSNGGSLLAFESVSAECVKVAGYKRLSRSMRLTNSYENSDNYNNNDDQNIIIHEKQSVGGKNRNRSSLSLRFINKVFSFSKKKNNNIDDGIMRQRLEVSGNCGTEEKKKKKRFRFLLKGHYKETESATDA